MNQKRLRKLQASLRHPLLIKKKENIFYLLGQTPMDGQLLIYPSHSSFRQLLARKGGAARSSLSGSGGRRVIYLGSGLEKIEGVRSDRLEAIDKYLDRYQKLQIENDFSFAEAEFLKSLIPTIKLEPVKSSVGVMRLFKDARELSLIRANSTIVERLWGLLQKDLRTRAWNEIGLARRIWVLGEKLGAEFVSFNPIVASGPNAAIPHHRSGKRRLQANESIIIDFGFKYRGYCSDFTRTIFLKRAPQKLTKVYNQVEKAYKASLAFIESSLRGKQQHGDPIGEARLLRRARNDISVSSAAVYQKAVSVLAEANLDKYFIHNLGHGCGLEIHEAPSLSAGSKDVLRQNMVFSMEPGVYLPKFGGVRIEDLVYLRRYRVNKFTQVPTKLADNIII